MPQLTFTPAEIEAYTRWTPEATRDLRHKGFLSNYGSQSDAGRWKYSIRDLIAFWMADHLRDAGFPVHQLLATSWTSAEAVINLLQGITAGERYVAFLFTITALDDGDVSGWTVVRVRSLAEIEAQHSFAKADILDLKAIAEAVPEKIRYFAKMEMAD